MMESIPMIQIFRSNFLCAVLACFAAAATAATTDSTESLDWPCDQALVHEIPAAVVWEGPSVEGLEHAWQKNEAVDPLVQRLTSVAYDRDRAEREIAEFASQQEAGRKDRMLTLLFAGVLEELNQDRSRMLNGILRYSRGQAIRANRLGEDLDEIARLEEDASEDAKARLAALHKQMLLEQRIFDEREAFIQHLCARPVVIEQRLGFLARTIASHLN